MIASKIGWSVGVLFSLGLLCSACGGSAASTTSKPNDATICDPGTRRCAGDEIKRCNQAGTSETIEQTCAPGQCFATGRDAICDTRDIPDDTRCFPAAKSCQNGNVYLCSTDGSSLSLLKSCTDSELCDAVLGTCLTQRCEPSKATCQGTRAVTCNAAGSDWLPASTDCAAQSKVCVAGSCEKKSCTPSATFCLGGDLYQCDPGGASSALSKTCRPGFEHCEATPAGNVSCVPDTCVAGQELCDGNVVKTCNADGSRPKDGTACGKGEVCESAQCKAVGCSQGTVFCKGQDIYKCEPSGPVLSSTCDVDLGETCLAIIDDPEPSSDFDYGLTGCVRQCPPGETGCVHNQLGTCAADGVSLSAVTTDCAANSQVCTAATDCTVNVDTREVVCATPATCAASVTDTLARAAHPQALSASPYLGNVVNVLSARKLTELQMGLVLSSPADLRWIVFEQVGSEFVARAEKTLSAASGTGFISSGPQSFNYPLEAGKRYALGVILPVGSISYNTSAEELPITSISFGSVLGSVTAYATDRSSFSIPGNFAASTISQMKVTTESP